MIARSRARPRALRTEPSNRSLRCAGIVATGYRIALEVELLKEQTQREKLFVAIQHRHDCVHRNGRDKNNEKLTVFTKAYVTETAELFRALIERVDLALSPF